MSSSAEASGRTPAAARAMSSRERGASTVADCPVSRLEKRSTSASKRRRISSGVDLRGDMVSLCPPARSLLYQTLDLLVGNRKNLEEHQVRHTQATRDGADD